MGVGYWRALRILAFVFGAVLSGPTIPATAGPMLMHAALSTDQRAALSREPFGLTAASLPAGSLHDKWADVEQRLEQERSQLTKCLDKSEVCSSPAAQRMLAIVELASARDGLARLGEVNRAVNLAIRPVSDLVNYGVIDFWSSPLTTFAKGSGDCEDYAIAKILALELSGVDASDLRLVIVHDPVHQQDHALAAARLDGAWRMLDNRKLALLRDDELVGYEPAVVLREQGVDAYRDNAPINDRLDGDTVTTTTEIAMLSFGYSAD